MKIYIPTPPPIAYVSIGEHRVTITEEGLDLDRAKSFMEKFFSDHFCLSGPNTCLVRVYKGKFMGQKSVRFSGSPDDLYQKFIRSLGGDPAKLKT